ncbi:hypothetical protein C8F01DRAFT_979857 [Mycena amicta]|nr:hypothetical protein C8F01DRAFT_979857 [Mycena amicta]
MLVHTQSTAGRGVPALDLRASADSCDDINSCRKLFDIVWGCLATIFACTWVSVHPNVPPPNQTHIALFWRGLKIMLIAFIAPELILGSAAHQFLVARLYSTGGMCSQISMTHAFFVSMGGFVARDGSGPIATSKYWHHISDIRAMLNGRLLDSARSQNSDIRYM